MQNSLSTVVVLGLLAGCTGTETQKAAERGVVPEIDSATHGLLVGSAMFSGVYEGEAKAIPFGGVGSRFFKCQVYSMWYRSVDDREQRVFGNLVGIPHGGSRQKLHDLHDYKVDDGLGFVNAIVLPAGQYEVWQYSVYCGAISYGWNDVSVPFEAIAGQAGYIGEIQFHHEFNGSLGIAGFDGAPVRVEDKMKRDVALLLEQYDFLRGYEIVPLELDWRRLYVAAERSSE